MTQTPFDLVFGSIAIERFPQVLASLEAAGTDPHDLDAFVLDREVVGLLRDVIPDEPGEALAEHLALLHHAYLYWQEGGWSFRLSRLAAQTLLTGPSAPDAGPGAEVPRSYYIEFPSRVLWATLEPERPPEPLDGLFIRPWPEGGYFVLGIFGMHPRREGFTVVDLDGFRPDSLEREDGTPPFSPEMVGGQAAGLFSLQGPEEILELAARTVPLVAKSKASVHSSHRPHTALDLA